VWLFALMLIGCQPTVRLMPTPAVLAHSGHHIFSSNAALEPINEVQVFYATNRAPLGPRESRIYTILPTQTLYFGNARIRIGPQQKAWQTLLQLSTSSEAIRRPVLRMKALTEATQIKTSDPGSELSPEARHYFDTLDAAIERSWDKDITVYVHGSNTTLDTAAAQAAQYRHFTGRNSVVLFYAWPSAGMGLRYFTDVQHARLSVPVFTRLIELLARHTRARHINVIAYSAGAQIISAGLPPLGRHGGGRLGEIYYAAPDVALPSFVANLPHYVGAARRVTVSVNLNDAVLGISAWFQGVSRLGRPDPSEISESDSRWLVEASSRLDFDVISVEPTVIPNLPRRSHSFWYSNPWVSSDVLMKLLFHLPPPERGLMPERTGSGIRYWTFPPDYDQRAAGILQALMKTLDPESLPP
jgi:esterase/lipase superfamily enzyme